jgi:hypothetical protein
MFLLAWRNRNRALAERIGLVVPLVLSVGAGWKDSRAPTPTLESITPSEAHANEATEVLIHGSILLEPSRLLFGNRL